MANLEPFNNSDARARFIEKYDAVLSNWPVAFQERDVATAFGATHVIEVGPEAPPLILLHGAAFTSVMWSPIIDTLSASYRCYCIDTITDGNKSIATRRVRHVTNLVAWLRQVFGALDIENEARVAGFSYGGWLAANLAVHAPELVNRLVLLCPAATLAPIPAEFYVRVFSSGVLRSAELARRFAQWMSGAPRVYLDPTVDMVVESLLSCRPFRREMTPPTVLADDELRRIATPTTVVIGERDVLYRGGPEAALARARKLIPEVRTCLVPGANHSLTVDCPEELAAEMVTALA